MSSGHPRRSWWQHLSQTSQTPLVSTHLITSLHATPAMRSPFGKNLSNPVESLHQKAALIIWNVGRGNKMKQKQQIWIDLEQMQCKRQHKKTSQFIRLLQVNTESQPRTRTAWVLPKFQHCARHHNGMASLWWLDNLGVAGLKTCVYGCQLKGNHAIGCPLLPWELETKNGKEKTKRDKEKVKRDEKRRKETKRDEKRRKETKRGEKRRKETKRDEKRRKETKRDEKRRKETKRDEKRRKETKRCEKRRKETKRDEKRRKETKRGEKRRKETKRDEKRRKETKRDEKRRKETKRDEKRRKEAKRDEKRRKETKRANSSPSPMFAQSWLPGQLGCARSQHQALFAKPHTVCLRKELFSRLGRINAYITRFLFFSETLMYSTNIVCMTYIIIWHIWRSKDHIYEFRDHWGTHLHLGTDGKVVDRLDSTLLPW